MMVFCRTGKAQGEASCRLVTFFIQVINIFVDTLMLLLEESLKNKLVRAVYGCGDRNISMRYCKIAAAVGEQ